MPKDTSALRRAVRARIQEAVQACAMDLHAVAVKEAPKDKGTLKGSSPVPRVRWEGDSCRANIGFNTPYALYQHEGVSRFSGRPLQYNLAENPNAKSKFLERNARQNRARYERIIRKAVAVAIKENT